jgi:hypothetical protein
MKHSILPILLSMILAVAGCGSPEVSAPDSLDWVKKSHDGARDLPLNVAPSVHFNGDVDGASVTSASVYLESATLNWNAAENKGTCEGAWSPVTGQTATEGEMVSFTPDADLVESTCYRMTCTTAVQGTELGPLRAQPCNPDDMESCRRDVGVEQTFWTKFPD